MAEPQAVTVQRVQVTDLDISFGKLVGLMVKVAFAAIPAMMILGFFMFVAALVLGAMGMGLGALAK